MSYEPQRNLRNHRGSVPLATDSHATSSATHNAGHSFDDKSMPGHGSTNRTSANTKSASSTHHSVATKGGGTNIGETEHVDPLERYKTAERKLTQAENELDELRREREELHQQLARETSTRLKYERDIALLHAQITDITKAQEPIREEKYYALELRQIGIDIESWAAKETQTTPTQLLSKADAHVVASELRDCGEHGKAAGEWFENNGMYFSKKRHSLLALIRHVIAIVLFDRVFDRFIFGFSRGTSEYFEAIEQRICLNESYSFANILRIRQAIGRGATEARGSDIEAARASAITLIILLLKILLPNTSSAKTQSFAIQTADKAISLRMKMSEEQAIYRFYFCDSGEEFNNNWMEVGTGETSMGKIIMCTFPGLRRFIMNGQDRNFIAVVKATTKNG